MKSAIPILIAVVAVGSTVSYASASSANELPVYLRDRGTGMPVSIFGTYIGKGQLMIYPFYEYYTDRNLEYEPASFGFAETTTFRGRYRASEGILFVGYGISDRLAIEVEAGVIRAKLRRGRDDLSTMPPTIEEAGLSDVEGQVRWRWIAETVGRPEIFSYFETVLPTGKKNSLIGTSDLELKAGTGLIRGSRWGTVTVRAGGEYSSDGTWVASGAVEYLKRLSSRFRFFVMVEGTQAEASLIPEMQWHFSRRAFLKVNSGLGVTSNATDFAPELGVLFSL